MLEMKRKTEGGRERREQRDREREERAKRQGERGSGVTKKIRHRRL